MQSRPRDGRTEWWRTRTPICHRANRHTVFASAAALPARQPQVRAAAVPRASSQRAKAQRGDDLRFARAHDRAVDGHEHPHRRHRPHRRAALRPPAGWCRPGIPRRAGPVPCRAGAAPTSHATSAARVHAHCGIAAARARGMTAQQPELCTPEGPAASSPRARRRGRSCSVPRAGTRRALFAEAGGPSSASSLPVDASARCVARRRARRRCARARRACVHVFVCACVSVRVRRATVRMSVQHSPASDRCRE
jgi:hypothetical protein